MVLGFECFRRTRAFGKLRNDEVKAASGGLLNFRAMLIELFTGDKCGVEVGAVALKVGFAQMPVSVLVPCPFDTSRDVLSTLPEVSF